MVSAYLEETAFWRRSILSPELASAVEADFRLLTETPLSFGRLKEIVASR